MSSTPGEDLSLGHMLKSSWKPENSDAWLHAQPF